jgi:hypothetical protein
MQDLFNYLVSKPVDLSPRSKYANMQGAQQQAQEEEGQTDPRGQMQDPNMGQQMQPQIPVAEELLNALMSIVSELNSNAYKIADLLEPLTQVTNNLQQWYIQTQTNQEEEQGALKLQQLVNKQQQMAQIRASQEHMAMQGQQVAPPQQEERKEQTEALNPTQKAASVKSLHDLLRSRLR